MDIVDETIAGIRQQTGNSLREIVYSEARDFLTRTTPPQVNDTTDEKQRSVAAAISRNSVLAFLNGYQTASNEDFSVDDGNVGGWNEIPGMQESFVTDTSIPDYIRVCAIRHTAAAYEMMCSNDSETFFRSAKLGAIIPRSFVAGFESGTAFETEYWKTTDDSVNPDDILTPDDIRTVVSRVAYDAIEEVYPRIASNANAPDWFALFSPADPAYQDCRDRLYDETVAFLHRNFFPVCMATTSIDEKATHPLALGYVQAELNALLDCSANRISDARLKRAAAVPKPKMSDEVANHAAKIAAVRRCAELGIPTSIASLAFLTVEDLMNASNEAPKEGDPFYYVTALGYVEGIARYGEYLASTVDDDETANHIIEAMSTMESGIGDDDPITVETAVQDTDKSEDTAGTNDNDSNVNSIVERIVSKAESGETIEVSQEDIDDILIIAFIAQVGRSEDPDTIVEALSAINGAKLGVLSLGGLESGVVPPKAYDRFAEWFNTAYGDRADIVEAVRDNWEGECPDILAGTDFLTTSD